MGSLPRVPQLSQTVLPPRRNARGSLRDLRAYFFCQGQTPGQLYKNAGGREWASTDFPELGLNKQDTYYLCLRVQGMGDLNAVDIAQEARA